MNRSTGSTTHINININININYPEQALAGQPASTGHPKETNMIATSSPQHTPIRSALTAGTAALLCIALAACSSTSNKPAAAPGAAQTSAAAKSSDTSGPATTTGPANSSAAPPSAPGTGTGHACALLTQAKVESAFAQPFRAGSETVIPNGGICNFGSTDGHAHLLFTVSSWAAMSHAASAAGVSPSPVSGVGDEAFTVKPGSGAAPVLFVRKGSTGFYLAVSGPQVASLADHGLAKVEALAALILPRL